MKIERFVNHYLKEKKYYETWMYLIDEFYSILKLDFFIRKLSLWFLIIIIVYILLYLTFISLCHKNNLDITQFNANLQNGDSKTINQYSKLSNENNLFIIQNKNKKLPNDENLKKIVKFLKEQKHNEDILNEYCSICLEKFNDNEERIAEDLDSVTLRLLHNNENEKIDTLICGHKFHSNCISKIYNFDNECPLCKQKKKIKYNQNEKSMIYGLQNELNNHIYSEINFFDLYDNDFEND